MARVADPDPDWGDEPALKLGQQLLYVFDLGDDWTHLCTVSDKMIDLAQAVGLDAATMPDPLPYWGRARSPINTVDAGKLIATMTNAVPAIPNSVTFRRCAHGGGERPMAVHERDSLTHRRAGPVSWRVCRK
jgi:hypothetical protein